VWSGLKASAKMSANSVHSKKLFLSSLRVMTGMKSLADRQAILTYCLKMCTVYMCLCLYTCTMVCFAWSGWALLARQRFFSFAIFQDGFAMSRFIQIAVTLRRVTVCWLLLMF
jgi:hypothetical protein